jgi:predicted ATPase
LAHHYSEAGLKDEALPYWQKAGERAAQRSSNAEAVAHLRRALALLEELPTGQVRDERELELLIKLGPVLMGSVGWSDVSVRETYERAQRLCRDSDRPTDTFIATWGLWMHAQSRSEHRDAEAIAETLLATARQADDTELLLQAHHAAWTTCLYTGRLAAACEHINRGIALYDAAVHGHHAFLYAGHDPGVCGNCQLAITLWLLGYPDQAEVSNQRSVSLAQELQHAPTIAHASNLAARFEVMIRNPGLAASYADTAIALGEELGLPVSLFQGNIARGWVRVQTGDGEAGLAQISEAHARRLRTNHRSGASHYLGMFGEAYLMVGQLQEADGEIDEALRLASETEELVWEAELLRLRGEIRRQQRAFDDAEANFRSAMESAAGQDAKSLELRATLSLARLWADQGKRREARGLLQPIYDWFTEGFTTPDLKDAKEFLDQLH